jgi:sulfotransferase family protein
MLDVATLVAAACERAQRDDFGEGTWQEGLEVLVRALATEGDLNEVGEAVFADQITGYLVNRLEVERWYADHPEIDEQEIVEPLFGLGMPRTGSTALSFLLACDRSRRSLRAWEASTPCPPPESATEDTDPRIAASAAGIELTNQLFPDFVGMLPTSPTGPQECLVIMALDFRSQVFEGMALLPSYTDWILTCDMTPAYRYHKRVLKLLQWRCPPTRWWLKTPAHMSTIDALGAVYPDARFVMTHRDIGSVLPSVCALKQALMTPVTARQDLLALGRHEVALWSESLRRLIEFRDAGREDRFFDVAFSEVQDHPLAAVESLYRAMGDQLTTETRDRMARWWEESAQERRRGPRPDPAGFGLDVDGLRKDFAFYHDRFGIGP